MRAQITFAKQAEKFLADGASRKRNPLRPQTIRTYRSQLDTHLLPLIGRLPLHTIGNAVVSELVTKLADSCSPRTIALNISLIKKIRKSAITENGDQMFPYEWNAEVIDAPDVTGSKKAVVSAQAVSDAISKALLAGRAKDAGLYAIMAGTGLRIAEVLAIQVTEIDDMISTVWIPSRSKIIVRQQLGRTGFQPTKTAAGVREVDLSPELNNLLISNVKTDKGILILPDCESCYREHLEKDGIVGGFHTLRRFRVTHLKLQGVPDPLIKFWIGHAAGDITEVYTQVKDKIESRKEWATKAGLGFELPH